VYHHQSSIKNLIDICVVFLQSIYYLYYMNYKSAFQNKYITNDSVSDITEILKKRYYYGFKRFKQRALLTFEVVHCIFLDPEQFNAGDFTYRL